MNLALWQKNSLRLAAIVLLGLLLWPLLNWMIVGAVFVPVSPEACSFLDAAGEQRAIDGACWPAVFDTLPLLLFGRYPAEERWRLVIALVVFLAGSTLALKTYLRRWKLSVPFRLGSAALTLILCTVLLRGFESLGLPSVDTSLWGGLMLTVVLSVLGITVGGTWGLVLALARRSRAPVPRLLATGYIELIRGVPLITVLFFANYLLPLFLPAELSDMSELSRAAWALILFEAAYIAEVLRAGLGAVDPGQVEAAKALGMNALQRGRLIVLPQALRISTPALISTTVGLVKDTSLVAIIGLYDLLGAARNVPSIPEWIGHDLEPLLFAGLFYVVLSLGLDKAARQYELRKA